MQTRTVLRMVAVAMIGLTVFGQSLASADRDKEEFYGTGLRSANVTGTTEQVSDCGDSNPATNISHLIRTGQVTYTGPIQGTTILEGAGNALSVGLSDNCQGQTHTGFRVIDTFDTLTVAGRTGGAVVEIVGRGTSPGPGVVLNESRLRILCGTGELRGIHAEGVVVGSASPTGAASAFQLWVHFDHQHDRGFDFMCEGLGP
jgi:hypothetical protein